MSNRFWQTSWKKKGKKETKTDFYNCFLLLHRHFYKLFSRYNQGYSNQNREVEIYCVVCHTLNFYPPTRFILNLRRWTWGSWKRKTLQYPWTQRPQRKVVVPCKGPEPQVTVSLLDYGICRFTNCMCQIEFQDKVI